MNVEIWTFFPERWKARSRKTRVDVRRECNQRGWAYQEFPTTEEPLNNKGRSSFLIDKSNATNLYRRMHRVRAGVLSFEQADVCLHPDKARAVRRGELVSVRKFSMYKAFATRVAVEQPFAWLAPFELWLGSQGCSDEHDPRCLPLHVFATHGAFNLDDHAGRESFAARHGGGNSRVDAASREWRRDPSASHGHECLHAGGCDLPRGFHWDVQHQRPPFKIWNTSELWEVRRYINVFPDASFLPKANARRLI